MTSPRKKKPSAGKGEQKLRIIGGRWRGRTLPFPDVEGLRPTGNRVRETLFNWLMPVLPGSRCLDLFAGSGALGFEALSRGAAHCTLVEMNRRASAQLRANVETLNCREAEVVAASALAYLGTAPPQAFDIVFIDPPFAEDLWPQVVTALQQPGWLAPGACIYMEMPREKQLTVPQQWRLHRQKQAGQVRYCLYHYETNPQPAG